MLLSSKSCKVIHYVVPSPALLDRDRADFADYFTIGKYQHQIYYHEALDFTPKKNSAMVVDEADVLIFKDPKRFTAFV